MATHRHRTVGVALHELYYGAFKSRFQADSLQKVTEIGFVVVPFDAEDARLAGEIQAVFAQADRPIGLYDTLIASQALSRNLILVTSNMRQFRRIQNLISEDWTVPKSSL